MARRAVVVGAGIGGLASAIGLRQNGWDVTILERWQAISAAGTSLGVWPEAQKSLELLGLGGSVAAAAVPYTEACVRDLTGRTLAALPLGRIAEQAGRPIVLVSRGALIHLLLERVRALGGVDLRTGVVVDDPGGLASSYDLVIAADGLRSPVRSALFGDRSRPTPLRCVAWRGTVEVAADVFGETWGRGQIFGVTPIAPNRLNWYAAVSHTAGTAASLADLRVLYQGWHPLVGEILDAARPELSLHHELADLQPPLRSYTHGTVALVGDSAHASAPSLGQGACQALIDATTLAEALQETDDLPAALATYDQRRRRPTQRLVVRSRQLLRLTTADRATGLRDRALRLSAAFVR